jgi:hypothetical protein
MSTDNPGRCQSETERENGTCDGCGHQGWVGRLHGEWLCLDCGLGSGIDGSGSVLEWNSGGGHIILDKDGRQVWPR